MQCVRRRDKKTLFEAIHNHVLPETTIVTDEWRGYRGLEEDSEYEYHHLTVNHSKNYTDPLTGATTNHVENMWRQFKRQQRNNYGRDRRLLNSCCREFMWRQRYAKPRCEAYHYFIKHLKEQYSFESETNQNSSNSDSE